MVIELFTSVPHVSSFALVYLKTVSGQTRSVFLRHWMKYIKFVLCQVCYIERLKFIKLAAANYTARITRGSFPL
jgi:hypothetical protein